MFQTWSEQMPRKLQLRWVGPYWIVGGKNGTYSPRTLNRERLAQPLNGFRMKPDYGRMLLNPFLKELQTDAMKPAHIGGPPIDPFRGSMKLCGGT